MCLIVRKKQIESESALIYQFLEPLSFQTCFVFLKALARNLFAFGKQNFKLGLGLLFTQVFVQRNSGLHAGEAEGSMRLNMEDSRAVGKVEKGSRGIRVDNEVISLRTLHFRSMLKAKEVSEEMYSYARRGKDEIFTGKN